MNDHIENLEDGSILIHFELGNGKTKTIRIDATERTMCEVWSRVILLRPSTSSGLRRDTSAYVKDFGATRPPMSKTSARHVGYL